MLTRGIVFAVSAIALLGVFAVPALSASQQDYDDCTQTTDINRSMAACTRVIADQAQSATDRAAAYVQRGNDHLAQGKLDNAIGDYGVAIDLDPQNVIAYAARAIAYLRLGDRAHAIADYRHASMIDAAKVAELSGGNPELKTVAAVASEPVALLYEEAPNNPQGNRFAGSVIWRSETISPNAGLPSEPSVHGDIDIPGQQWKVIWSLRRNTDKSLPASHTIEIRFATPLDVSGGGIAEVAGILMKNSETARGTPLAALSVKVANGYFLIGLNAAEVQRNVDVLKTDSWFDVPVIYADGKRAILTIEKAASGRRVFAEAFAAWGE